MSTTQPTNRTDWLIFFRRAKTVDTLDVMLDAALRKLTTPAEQADAILGHEARLDEIEGQKRLTF
ncbi:hypothetical protein BCT30_06575 [Enterovibrio norvegicus]|uniref:Uncharacterized protein n=2 Tax=Enterovibrio norvegicus TaxID=188144 RepID=A0A1I5JXS9_9GAMM|nr:hypothetical protein [Enterovibrio norvegicus]MCC4797277.1 hypothetical protein [Enterovibrio norvegicus]OEE60025.1 hypothetical protein A1OS_20530 [Enterovibrio norvegicus]OEF49568.1 hypothetical protein A1OW_12430 [Enterovibrio norvegicus]OEF58338.1 hypothetical protein A1OU_09120 [Enterovibrio norvegicus]PMH72267.1 hypothetical protein BCU62_23385 [Enterovibrio norvegicus]